MHNRAAGGGDELANLVTLCRPCHDAKTTRERAAGVAARKARCRLPAEPHPGLRGGG
ncbi:HNH endonuclease [Gordonia sp. (in: high G+C Gram-positive bacteria)]|uniref:HNH endonuclease n=1 Tax=Gordonia sp. (in: high G+C Gram-positive bacteria) TaxID=84139 RepID=UPI00391B56FF